MTTTKFTTAALLFSASFVMLVGAKTKPYTDSTLPTGTGEICITKFYDSNKNGVRDTGEPGLAGFQFKIMPGNTTVTTGPSGGICFGRPAPATYTITEILQTGYMVTGTNPQTVGALVGKVVNVRFGNVKK